MATATASIFGGIGVSHPEQPQALRPVHEDDHHNPAPRQQQTPAQDLVRVILPDGATFIVSRTEIRAHLPRTRVVADGQQVLHLAHLLGRVMNAIDWAEDVTELDRDEYPPVLGPGRDAVTDEPPQPSPPARPFFLRALRLIMEHLEEYSRTGFTDMFARALWHVQHSAGGSRTQASGTARAGPIVNMAMASASEERQTNNPTTTTTTSPNPALSRRPLIQGWYRVLLFVLVILNRYNGLGCSDTLLAHVSDFAVSFMPYVQETLGEGPAATLLMRYALVYRDGSPALTAKLGTMWAAMNENARGRWRAMAMAGAGNDGIHPAFHAGLRDMWASLGGGWRW